MNLSDDERELLNAAARSEGIKYVRTFGGVLLGAGVRVSMIRTYIPPVITTYIPPRQVGDGPWTPWYADYYHRAV